MAAARKYQIGGLPAILFLNTSGEVEGRIGGYLPPEAFSQRLTEIMQAHRDFPRLQARYKAHPSDISLAMRLASIYSQRGNAASAATTLAQAEKYAPKSKREQLHIAYMQAGATLAQQHQLIRAVPFFRRAAVNGKQPNEVAQARLSAAICNLMQNRLAAAVPDLQATLKIPGVSEEFKQQARQTLLQVQQQLKLRKHGGR